MNISLEEAKALLEGINLKECKYIGKSNMRSNIHHLPESVRSRDEFRCHVGDLSLLLMRSDCRPPMDGLYPSPHYPDSTIVYELVVSKGKSHKRFYGSDFDEAGYKDYLKERFHHIEGNYAEEDS